MFVGAISEDEIDKILWDLVVIKEGPVFGGLRFAGVISALPSVEGESNRGDAGSLPEEEATIR